MTSLDKNPHIYDFEGGGYTSVSKLILKRKGMSAQYQNISPRGRAHPFSSLSRKSLLIPEIIRDHIRHLVDCNDLDGASKLLLELMELYAPKKVNEMIIIRRGIADIEEATRVNTQDFGVISRERNRLGLAILELADVVCFF